MYCKVGIKMEKFTGYPYKSTQNTPFTYKYRKIRELSEKFVDWQQCSAILQREAVTVMPSCGGGGNVVVA
jgi:hypothetical protein